MAMEHAMERTRSCARYRHLDRKAKPKEVRDPYDGLRPWSAITHGVGAALAVFGAVLLIVKAVGSGVGALGIVAFSVYGASMIALYLASTLYHCIWTGVKGRIALRKFDHASIYALIAGTYTPICLLVLKGAWGWSLFGIIWGFALAGMALSIAWINAPRMLTSVIYLVMGWLAVIALYPLLQTLPAAGFFWLLFGGVLYTVGGVLYALKWPGRANPRFGCHEIFHVFILLGSVAHSLLMYRVIAEI